MNHGFGDSSPSGCCDKFDVWGISCNAPNFLSYYRELGPTSFSDAFESYDLLGDVSNDLGTTSSTVYKPELFPRVAGGTNWPMFASKVPSSYPYGVCSKFPLVSSHSGGTWSVQLENPAVEHYHYTIDTTDYDEPYFIYCFGSRAIYVDGEQKYVGYRYSSFTKNNQPFNDTYYAPDNRYPGKIAIIDINAQTLLGTYDIETADQNVFGTATTMENSFYNDFAPGVISVYNFHGCITAGGLPAQNVSIGRDYAIYSTYHPTENTGGWNVCRAQYTGTRLGVPESLKIFNAENVGVGPYRSDYQIMLPSNRVYIRTTGSQPDECWVCAKTISPTPKLVTGRWLSDVYKPGVGSEDESTGMADGTLATGEIQNIILDASNPPAEYADESWADLQVRSYNHINGDDLLIFTTAGDGGNIVGTQSATFETGNINAGLPTGVLHFDNGGSEEFDIWIGDTNYVQSGTHSATTQFQDVTKIASVILGITVNVTTQSDMTFWYIHDNRKYGSREPPWVSLTNFPEPENGFTIKVNGQLTPITIGTTGYDSSYIDNVFVPSDNPNNDPDWYLSWRKVTITLPPGTNRITWTTNRRWQDNGHLQTWIDSIIFPELLLGDDINAKKRWFFAGGKLRRAKYWTWAKYDDEYEYDIASRVSTVPDFITKDNQGRIYYGNPHYVCRILIDENGDDSLDETFGGPGSHDPTHNGYFRFTASPNVQPLDDPCEDNDPRWASDQIDDPKWGGFQILPTNSTIQIRGANGTLRDADKMPWGTGMYLFTGSVNSKHINGELFKSMAVSKGRWSQRPSCWTLSLDGKSAEPHLEMLWRGNIDNPTWPDHAPFNVPPYASNFDVSDFNEWTPGRPGSFRPRDVFNLRSNSTAPRLSHTNWILPRSYSDAFSRPHQFCWYSRSYDPPNDPMDPVYWHPDWDVATAVGLGVYGGPWGSARWSLIQSHHCPTSFKWILYNSTDPDYVDLCIGDTGTGDQTLQAYKMNIKLDCLDVSIWPITDFDAVDNSGGSCC